MEQLLLKLARQLDSMDEASLTALWEKYANIVNRFEPTDRWQEAAMVLSFIQAKRWKNQLFNFKWAARSRQNMLDQPALQKPIKFALELEKKEKKLQERPKAKVSSFVPRQNSSDISPSAENPE